MPNKSIARRKQVVSFQCFQCLTLVSRKVKSRSQFESLICENQRCQAEHERMRHSPEYAKKYQKKLNEAKKQLPTKDDLLTPKLLFVGSDRELFYGSTCLGKIVKWDKETVYVVKLSGTEVWYRIASIKNPEALKAG